MSRRRDLLNGDISVVLCGEAGQGLQTVEQILNVVLKRAGYYVFSTSEFMSRIRGGANSTEIRISGKRVNAYVEKIDILIPLAGTAIRHLENRISSDTLILSDGEQMVDSINREFVEVPFSRVASQIGSSIYANTVAMGVILGMLDVEQQILHDHLQELLSSKGKDVVEKNTEAAKKGYSLASELQIPKRVRIARDPGVRNDILLTGTEAVALGALAGGCNFVSFYPMSPSTGVAISLAQRARQFGVVVEQAEGEIAAMNMALGAWYAGGRAMVTTSGGGFDLMTEGLSLAGITESPVVIHVAQRPGGATGFPTRTEQADLEIALYSAHGEFPRAIFSPGTVEDAFYLTHTAFNLADKYQVPALILTDQYFLDSYYQIPLLDPSRTKVESTVVRTDGKYKRYALSENGVSPRGIPGFGDGLVVVAGNEHDEEGHLTEDGGLRTQMVRKRLKKLRLLEEEVVKPDLVGGRDYRTLVVGWGSTYHAIRETLERLRRSDVSFLHFRQVHPLHQSTLEYLERADKVIVVEGNATAQFARHIESATGFKIDHRILKYNGRPFSVEEIFAELKRIAE